MVSIDPSGVALANLTIVEHNFASGQNQFQGSSGQPNVRLLHAKTAIAVMTFRDLLAYVIGALVAFFWRKIAAFHVVIEHQFTIRSMHSNQLLQTPS